MSDHLCELRDDLLKKEEELEHYRRNTSGKVSVVCFVFLLYNKRTECYNLDLKRPYPYNILLHF